MSNINTSPLFNNIMMTKMPISPTTELISSPYSSSGGSLDDSLELEFCEINKLIDYQRLEKEGKIIL
jgi:hypothetical protein